MFVWRGEKAFCPLKWLQTVSDGENASKLKTLEQITLISHVKNVSKVVVLFVFRSGCLKGTVSDVFYPKVRLNLQPHF